MKKTSTLAKLAIVLATIIWGSSFVIIKDAVNLITPNYLMAIRFTGAFILLSIIFFKRMKNITPKMLLQGAVIGACLFGAYFFQTLGIMETTPGKNAFLTAFYCVLVPFIAWVTGASKPDKWNLIAAFVCIAGIGFISLNRNFTMSRGDALTLVGGFFFACHMVAVAKFGEDNDPIVMTVLQFAGAAVIFWIATFAFEGVPKQVVPEVVPAVFYLCVFCTAAALLLQNFGQKYTEPSTAALLLTLESVLGTLISGLLGRENLTFRTVFGFALVFCAIVVSETKLSFLKKKKEEVQAIEIMSKKGYNK